MRIAEDAFLEEGEMTPHLRFPIESSARIVEVDLAGTIKASVIPPAQFIELAGSGIGRKAVEKV